MKRSDASTSIKIHVDMTIDEVCHRSYEASTSNTIHAVSMDEVCHRSTEQKKHQTTTENAAAWEVVRDVEGQRVRRSPVEWPVVVASSIVVTLLLLLLVLVGARSAPSPTPRLGGCQGGRSGARQGT